MKKIYLLLILISSLITIKAQNTTEVKELISKGNRVFIEVVDKNKNTAGAIESFKTHLLDPEWNRWVLAETSEGADFICRLNIEKKGVNLMSMSSMGARVRTIVEILTTDGKTIWQSKRQQGNVSIYTGGDALSDAMRKVIRRSLKIELYGETE